MAEHLVKAVVTKHIVTALDENGVVIDAVVGQHVMVNENSLEAMKDRLKRVETSDISAMRALREKEARETEAKAKADADIAARVAADRAAADKRK